MRRLVFALILCCTTLAHARGDGRSGKGLGLSLGDPTGLNFKIFLGRGLALDNTLGLEFIGGRRLGANSSLVWQQPLGQLGGAPVDWYYGLGAKLGIYDDDKNDERDDILFGARAPVGLSVIFKRIPMDLFLEVGPALWLIGDIDLDLDGAIGVRFWF